MQNYINGLQYIPASLTKKDIQEIACPSYERLIIDPEHPSYRDACEHFSQTKYKYPYLPLYLGHHEIPNVEKIDLNVLRLLIRMNNSEASIYLPMQLLPLKELILSTINYHRQAYSANKDCFVYLTVRACTFEQLYYKNSMGWHIDGFQGSRIERHIIEQDAFWCNLSATQFLLQPMFCEGLNPTKHDINMFFDNQADSRFMVQSLEKSIYLATPYNIHRVNPNPFDGKRVFVRINFSPVLIEDHTNTLNPEFPEYKFKPRVDVRDFLWQYNACEVSDSGFIFA